MRTCVMEDKVGDIVGENCLGCCLLESPPMGRVKGLSGTLRRGEAFREAYEAAPGAEGAEAEEAEGPLKPGCCRLGLPGADGLLSEVGREGLLREDEREGLLTAAGLLGEECSEGVLREAWMQG